jgi:hypothetical protein
MEYKYIFEILVIVGAQCTFDEISNQIEISSNYVIQS